jgi:hypothetical protein
MINDRKAAPASTVEELRHEIDSGRAGDKISGSDPAAAPLPTDDEAAGFPPSQRRVAQARSLETARPSHEASNHGLGATWILIAVISVLGGGAVAWAVAYW